MITDPSLKDRFEKILMSKGIAFESEPSETGTSIWIEDEDRSAAASKLLSSFLNNPEDNVFIEAEKKGAEVQKQLKQEQVIKKVQQSSQQLATSGASASASRVMIGISVALFVIRAINPALFEKLILWFLIIDPTQGEWGGLSSGQIWRLWTPMFWHMGVLHLLFNCWWMWDLGRGVERYLGTMKYLRLVTLISIPAHLAQLLIAGPFFGGLSGVVYGLLGYVYWNGKRNPHSPMQLPPQTMIFMMAWLVLGVVAMPNMANGVHIVGLAMGVLAAQLKRA